MRFCEKAVCHDCYACKGRFRFSAIQQAQNRRLNSLNHPQWVEAMTLLIGTYCRQWFRWHSSGDIQSGVHLRNIAAVAAATPHIQHWLPTKEEKYLLAFLRQYPVPENLHIRFSTYMLDDARPPAAVAEAGIPLMAVYTEERAFRKANPGAYVCPTVPRHVDPVKRTCGDCRACWDSGVALVGVHKH